MNLVRPTLCSFFALAALACTPAALAVDLCPLQMPSLTPSLPSIPAAPAVQPMPAAVPVRAMPVPVRAVPARAAQMSVNADGEPCFFQPPVYAPSAANINGDDDGCIPRPIKPTRPHFDPQNGDVVDLRGVDTDKPVKILR